MTKPKAKGTAAETAVVGLLKATYWPYAERRALSGNKDKGDTTGHPGFIIEVKAAKAHPVPAWLRETELERHNDKADFGILAIKPSGVGVPNVDKWTSVMTQGEAQRLWALAGSPARAEFEYSGHSLNTRSWLNAIEGRRVLAGYPFGWAVIRPRGVDEWNDYHNYMYLGQRLELLYLAGYGGRKDDRA